MLILKSNIYTLLSHKSILFAIGLMVVFFVSFTCADKAAAQSILGQNGTILNPGADIFPEGNFMLGGYFRSMSSESKRYDAIPIYMTTGISPSMEIGLSLPSLSGGGISPSTLNDFAQISFKQRIIGKDENENWRLSVAGLLQRGIGISSLEDNETAPATGFQILSSHNIRTSYILHAYAGGVFPQDDELNNYMTIGMGVSKIISNSTKFIGDISAQTKRRESDKASINSLAGLRYYFKKNFVFTVGGGIGLAEKDVDWQYLMGLTITTSMTKHKAVEPKVRHFYPPPLSLLEKPLPTFPPLRLTDTIEEDPPLIVDPNIKFELNNRLFFDFAGYTLSQGEDQILRAWSEDIRVMDDVVFRIMGHTDFIGRRSENLGWGLARSLHVLSKINDISGISPDRFLLTSSGEDHLANLLKTESAHQLNRRVKLHVWNDYVSSFNVEGAEKEYWVISDGKNDSGRQTINQSGSYFSQSEILTVIDALREIGDLRSSQILLIEAASSSENEYYHSLAAAALLWKFISDKTTLNTSQIFITPVKNHQDNHANVKTYPNAGIGVELLEQPESFDTLRVKVRLSNESGNRSKFEGRYVFVADYSEGRVTSYGESLQADVEPDPARGMEFSFEKLIDPIFELPLSTGADHRYQISLYMYDNSGKLIQRSPLLDTRSDDEWLDRFNKAMLNNENPKQSASGLTLKLLEK